jgi:IPT/TIG domain
VRKLIKFVGMAALIGLTVTGVSTTAGAKSSVPKVTSVVPDHGSVNGGTTVAIKGSNIINATSVSFGSEPATNFTFKSGNTIQAVSPPGTGVVDITVTTPDGTSAPSSADTFTYVNTPAIQSLSPKSGATTGGNKVTIIGSDLSEVTAVTFGSSPATSFTVNSSQSITALSPAESVGTVNVTVTSPDGTSPTDPAARFTYSLHVPKVTSVAPDVGPLTGGTRVTITGSGFTKVTAVEFGSASAEAFTVNNQKSITATSPAGVGQVDVTVTNSKGASATTSLDVFTYTTPSA